MRPATLRTSPTPLSCNFSIRCLASSGSSAAFFPEPVTSLISSSSSWTAPPSRSMSPFASSPFVASASPSPSPRMSCSLRSSPCSDPESSKSCRSSSTSVDILCRRQMRKIFARLRCFRKFRFDGRKRTEEKSKSYCLHEARQATAVHAPKY